MSAQILECNVTAHITCATTIIEHTNLSLYHRNFSANYLDQGYDISKLMDHFSVLLPQLQMWLFLPTPSSWSPIHWPSQVSASCTPLHQQTILDQCHAMLKALYMHHCMS